MMVEDGPAHINSYDHKARLAQLSASVLASRIEELRYPASAFPLTLQRPAESTQTEVRPLDDAAVSASFGGALWICTLCDREMQLVSKADHLAGKTHAKKLISGPSILLIPLQVRSTTSRTLVANEVKERKIAKPKPPVLQSYTCPSCNAIIKFQQKASHSCLSYDSEPPIIDGPLDSFFQLYHSFRYDASTPSAVSFNSLQNHLQKRHGWGRDHPECKKLWNCYQAALTQEFNLWFGTEDNLDAWHSLCRGVRIEPFPTTCELCRSVGPQSLLLRLHERLSTKQAVRGRHVNIIDLIEWGRSGGKHVQVFRTVKELSDYSFGN